MTNRNRLLYALVLLPTLLLTSCYKDFNKVRVKPFKPDLVVPLAAVDSITFMQMLVKDVADLKKLDLISYKDDRRIGLRYDAFAFNNTSLTLSPSLQTFTIKDGNVSKDELIPGNSSSLKVQKIFFAKGAEIIANKGVTLSLEGGSELKLNSADYCAPLDKVCTLVLPTGSNDCTLTFKNENESVDSVEVEIETLSALEGTPDTVTLGAFNGLLWYSGELTDPRVAVKIETKGWLARVKKLKYWIEGSSVKTKKNGEEEERPLVGWGGNDPLPFNEKDKHEFFAYWEKGSTQEKEYFFNQINMVSFSKKWPLSYTAGKIRVDCKGEVVTLHAGEKVGSVKANVALKLPFTGRFNALIREFRPGDDSAVSLPDVNKLLQDSGGKGRVKSRFTENDTVLLHFYFKNATPMDIYLAAKIGGNNKIPKGEVGQTASVIEGLNSGIEGEELKKDNKLKIGDFEFFKAVEGADVEENNKKLGLADATKMKSKVVTIEIPYEEYETARTSIEGRQLRALLLFRSPNGTGQKPIVVSPRLDDYVSIRLGVEVKPEVSIELINKE